MAGKSALYKKKILKQLYFAGLLACADISARIDKSLSLTAKMLNELIEQGVVEETGYAPSSGGRRPLMYALKADIFYTVAVAMDQFFTRIVIMDMKNNPVQAVEKFELPLASTNKDDLPFLADKINELIQRSGIPAAKILAIGIGMPGFVNAASGVNYTFLSSPEGSVTDYISRKTGITTYIDNDSSLVALAELKFGNAGSKSNAMVINIGWGIGLGMILNGELFRGNDGFAGEFSHIPIFSNGKLCSCGKSGCLETETSLFVIVGKAKQGLANGKVSMLRNMLSQREEELERDAEAIFTAAGKGDRFAIELLSEAGYNIGRGIAVLIHLLNPGIVVLSGRGALAGKIWQAPIQQALNEHCIPTLAENTVVSISTLGYNAELVGSAALVMEKYGEAQPRAGIRPKARKVIA